ncbi:hypothetical protein AtDm6_1069 [Acetobacter tropicalis]|uniref:Uncharacterized protein n=1 Tax=Acetobacter tropicalis TaxID=104102 RepID=A0A095B707_9PROT|nr:hypothetical protein AtDm6_1069 [Acetobacter tropicalis]
MELWLVGLAKCTIGAGFAQFEESNIQIVQELCCRHKNLFGMAIDATLGVAIR